MINVTYQIGGQPAKTLEIGEGTTYSELRAQLGLGHDHRANRNGAPVDQDDEIPEFSFVTFTRNKTAG